MNNALYLKDFSLNHTNDLIFWSDLEGKLVYGNQVVADILGHQLSTLQEKHVWDIVVGGSKQGWTDQKEVLSIKQYFSLPVSYLKTNGSTFPTHTRLYYIAEDKGYICAVAKYAEPTSEKERLKDFTHQTLNQIQDIIIWSKLNGDLVYFNDAVITQLGYSREEFEFVKRKDLIKDYDTAGQNRFRKTMKTRKGFLGECLLGKKNGDTLIVEINTTTVFYAGETLNCTIFRDISQQKAKEQQLQKLLAENIKLKTELEAENTYLQAELKKVLGFEEIITTDKKYKQVLAKVEEVAPTTTTVLISGETGTGKELLARAVHRKSKRHTKPLLSINCATLSQNLIASELFGHEIGAFTGAVKQKKGLFEIADGGTLFLDEIGELPMELQAKLLRVLQEGEFFRLGSNTLLKVDVRIIAATNRKLPRLIKQNKFREDLYYRLNIFPLVNPPLRDRKADIPLLVNHFVKKFNRRMGKQITRLPQSIMDKLMSHTYPGNIRELENIIERAMIVSKRKTLNLNDWQPVLNNTQKDKSIVSLDALVKAHIISALQATNWKVTGKAGAAALLEMKDRTLQSKMRKLGIKRQDYMK